LNALAIPFSSIQLDRVVGEGAFGVVHLARLTARGNTQIACKMIKQTADGFPAECVQAFVDEANMLRKIPHSPYVVNLVGVTAEPFCILTDYIDGGSLFKFLQQPIGLPLGPLLGFLHDIVKGLDHLHCNEIIHR
jgi:serine/threonine protein kinase